MMYNTRSELIIISSLSSESLTIKKEEESLSLRLDPSLRISFAINMNLSEIGDLGLIGSY